MAYFPDKQAVKTELQEHANKFDLSRMHLTTANWFEPNIAYVRDNTTREDWKNNSGVFARPMPIQLPVMASAKLALKTYFVPYRVISPQWHDFITHSPHVANNGTTAIRINEMPYFKMGTLNTLFQTAKYATTTTGNTWDFRNSTGTKYVLTAWGRHCMKILQQLKYQILWGDKTPTRHWNALRILAFAKIYLDYYYSNQYAFITQESVNVEALFKKDNAAAYELTQNDFEAIFSLTARSFYEDDYFISQWDNAVSPNQVATSMGNIYLNDITMKGSQVQPSEVDTTIDGNLNSLGTPFLHIGESDTEKILTQYALDSLKKITDMARRYAISGIRSIDRYLARFGVLLTTEKMQRSEYYGKQETIMQFGAVYSTADTDNARVGDYAGQGMINSEGQENNQFELNDLKDMGCIMQIFTIIPKIGYCQGVDRDNMRTDPESYFNGIYDSLGTQATSPIELYVSEDGTGNYSKESYANLIFGYIARGAHWKIGLDNLTGDFRVNSMNNGDYRSSPWHMFRLFDDTYFNQVGQGAVVHTPFFVQANDADQYNRIFNDTKEEDGDHFVVLLTQKIDANVHARNLYDTYDFESEGKEIILNGMGPRQS